MEEQAAPHQSVSGHKVTGKQRNEPMKMCKNIKMLSSGLNDKKKCRHKKTHSQEPATCPYPEPD
jgi:hypothetical protein